MDDGDRHDYVIVGGGMTADAAVRGIRAVDPEGSIALISGEPDPPYDRPPLSKGLWRDTAEEKIWRDTSDEGCRILLDRRVVALDRRDRTVRDDRGGTYRYGELLLATGGAPRTLPGAAQGINYFRTYRDYRDLRDAAEERDRFAVIGGGFIGSEIAAALTLNEKDVVLLFPEEGICRRVLPPSLARHLNEHFRDRGVDVRPGALVKTVEGSDGEGFRLTLEGGETVEAEGVVAGLGVRPRVALAREAGLEVDQGIVADEAFRTGDPHVWAAGDVVRFPSSVLDRSLRIEHEDHANSSGIRAGQGMAGDPTPYDYVPFFYSDLFDLGYEALGIADPRLETVEDWSEPSREGVVYYLEKGRVRGVLLWNRRGRIRDARKLLREREPLAADDLKGLL